LSISFLKIIFTAPDIALLRFSAVGGILKQNKRGQKIIQDNFAK
jgi:hypothetical protein